MDACKLSASREGRKVEFELPDGGTLVLGRSRECDVVLRDPEISRQHCRVQFVNGRLLVTDLDSTHGVQYRGQRVQLLDLEIGDGFHIAHTFVRFDAIVHGKAAVAEPPAPAITMPLARPGGAPEAVAAAAAASDFAATSGGPSDVLPRGTRLGAFELAEPIGRGDRCTVYAANQPSLQRRVAVKVSNAMDGSAADAERATFLADAKANAETCGGALLSVFEVGEHGGSTFVAMERPEGASLAATLQAGQRMTWQQLAPLLAHVADALHRLHERGHVHGAVKPTNVFVDDAGLARLADLRAGTVLRPRESTAYAAPELLRCGAIDAPADIYSLGCVAYALLTGRPPYWGSQKQILAELQERRPASLLDVDASIPGSLDALIRERMLAPDATQRPPAAICRDLLRTCGQAPAAPPAPAPVAAATAPTLPRMPLAEPVVRRQPSSAKSFAARLTADAIIFGMVSAVLVALLLALKAATGFDLYAACGFGAR